MSIIAQHRRKIGLGLALVGVLLVIVWGVQVGGALLSLRGQMAEARALADDPFAADVTSAGEMLTTLRRDVVTLRRNVGWMTGFGPALRWLPGVGPLLAESRDLLALADGLTEIGDLLWDDVVPVAEAFQAGDLVMDDALALPQQIAGKLPRVRIVAAQAHAAYRRIDADALPGQFRDEFALLGQALPLLQEGLAWAAEAPDLLGQTGPRTYLLLALNEDELRPGGGYITGVGEVQIINGQVAAVSFRDSYAVDDFTQPYPLPPEPLRRFMGLDLWVFRDSNWSPDFPTAMRQALDLYRPDYPVDVAGVVAVDQHAVRELVAALGPLTVAGVAVPVTGDTLMDFIYAAWLPEGRQDREWWQQRKSFMEPLAAAALARIEAGEVDWEALAKAGLRLAEQKHLQMYLRNPQAAALLAARGLDGRVAIPEAGDFVMIVEANVGYNKASPRIARAFTYEVDLTHSPPRATLTLDYEHTSQADIACRVESRYDPTYQQMMDRCYWAHLRAFAPAGARLIDSSRHPLPAEAVASGDAWEGVAQVETALGGVAFSQAFLLPTRERTQVQFGYELPESVRWQDVDGVTVYRLTWQKQAGLAGIPARVILRLPQNAVVLMEDSDVEVCARPHAVLDDAGALLCEMTLDEDARIMVKYRVEMP